jgi:hypothetical protein
MKVSELKECLNYVDDDLLVVLSGDSEGNAFHELTTMDDNNRYMDRDVGIDHLTDSLEKAGYGEEDVMEGGDRDTWSWMMVPESWLTI